MINDRAAVHVRHADLLSRTSTLPAPFDFWIYGNALTGFVEVMRDIVLLGKIAQHARLWLDIVYVGRSRFYFGYWFFDRYRNVIVDVI